MIKIENTTLRVRKIRQSRNGPFAVADLSTEIGEFKVKDQLLDAFDEGEYRATVWVSEIFLAQYVAFGRGVTELRARLHDLQIQEASHLDDVPEQSEPDPIDEGKPLRVPSAQSAQNAQEIEASESEEAQAADGVSIAALRAKLKSIGKPKGGKVSASKHETAPTPGDELAALFGDELWARIQGREPVKLDPTVDRLTFRKQAELLGKLDYTFKPMEQTFHPVETVA
ncbi:MAG: hypothetical protein DI587_14785 [Variovorax paradoxus]|nr:MAG: hypothetical protein DI583_14785 [Variovorax paradoxus]PZQ09671.1 MAG: hypothetical protein DI587_14785 [Variovorax paradoxus]